MSSHFHPNIAKAESPPQTIDKGLAGPNLLAYVAVSKLGDRRNLVNNDRGNDAGKCFRLYNHRWSHLSLQSRGVRKKDQQ